MSVWNIERIIDGLYDWMNDWWSYKLHVVNEWLVDQKKSYWLTDRVNVWMAEWWRNDWLREWNLVQVTFPTWLHTILSRIPTFVHGISGFLRNHCLFVFTFYGALNVFLKPNRKSVISQIFKEQDNDIQHLSSSTISVLCNALRDVADEYLVGVSPASDAWSNLTHKKKTPRKKVSKNMVRKRTSR